MLYFRFCSRKETNLVVLCHQTLEMRSHNILKGSLHNKAYRPNAHLLDIFMQPKYQFAN